MRSNIGLSPRWAAAILVGVFTASAETPAPAPKKYESGFPTLLRITEDLYRALPPEHRKPMRMPPVLLDETRALYLQPGERLESNKAVQVVYVSPSLIELLNFVSHSKAIDQMQPGFFSKAVERLGSATADKGLAGLSQPTDEKAWTFNTMNWQMSYYNQMAAGLTAIELAHHYLGHYKNFADKLGDPKKPAPLYSVLPMREWREAVLAGSRHALECGLAPEGLVVLYDAITRMPQRPSWAVQIMPPTAEVSILRLELKRVEATFFDARTAARDELQWSW
jgi:hypothetical protein